MNRFGILFGPFSIKIQPQNRTYIKYKIHEVAAIFIVRLQDGDNFRFSNIIFPRTWIGYAMDYMIFVFVRGPHRLVKMSVAVGIVNYVKSM